MSGRNSLWPALVLVLAAGGLGAQSLPDIGEFEIEDVRLILLDNEGGRRGVLTGEMARKQRDGDVLIEEAELTVEREGGRVVLTAAEFRYAPQTSDFEAPEGMTVSLPDEGLLELPSGKGNIDYIDGVNLTLNAEGEGRLRSGREGASLVDATVTNPVITVKIDEVTDEEGEKDFAVDVLRIEGSRGGELKLRLAHLPAVDRNEEDQGEAVVTVSCFGNVSLDIDGDRNAVLNMLRRASMKLEEVDRTFEVTSNSLRIQGPVQRTSRENKESGEQEPRASLTDLAIDATQNVRILGDRFDGTSAGLRYREYADHREVHLSGDPQLNLDQGMTEEGENVRIALRSREYVNVMIPAGDATGRPKEIAVELFDGARVARLLEETQEWRIAGRMVRLFSWLSDEEEGADYNHAFDAYAEGYSALLRVNPRESGDPARDSGVDRAAVYGARAEGTVIRGRIETRVYGPDILTVVDADFPLADMLKVALGLAEQLEDGDGNPVSPPVREGRLTVRAARILDLDLLTDASVTDVALSARGAVELDHRPLPRDDADLLTLSGSLVELAVRDGQVQAARVGRTTDAQALATLGFDLLLADTIDVRRGTTGLATEVAGPGRMVIRDDESVAYFRNQLDRLPKRGQDAEGDPEPDAAWLNFGASLRVQAESLRRTLEGERPEFHLVYGDFEAPRAGRPAVDDLPELVEPDVQKLYLITGDRMYAESVIPEPGAEPLNVLRLEGNARVNSVIDGITARAERDIEFSGSENQRRVESPFSVIVRGNPRITVRRAGLFFGEYVRSGIFSYDGQWVLTGVDRLELTMRPLRSAGGELEAARSHMTEAMGGNIPMFVRVHELERARNALKQAISPVEPATDAAGLQPVAALHEIEDAIRHGYAAIFRKNTCHPGQFESRKQALAAARRARSLLSALIDVAGSGGVKGRFHSEDENVSPLTIEMLHALFTFNGLGELADVEADGPIAVSRAGYTIRGDRLSHAASESDPRSGGTLKLDGASITLPEDTGMKITGVQSISLTRREDTNIVGDAPRRTMVTRVSGRDLKVRVKLSRQEVEE